MDKRHRGVLSKRVILDSSSGLLGLIYFWVFAGEIKRAGGRAFEP
jgi:hypothetical protein